MSSKKKVIQVSVLDENEFVSKRFELNEREESIRQFRLLRKEYNFVRFEVVEEYDEEEGWMTMKDASELLNVRYQQVYQKIEQNRIESRIFNEKTFVRQDEILEWYDKRMSRKNRK